MKLAQPSDYLPEGGNGLALTAWTNIISGTNFPPICLLPAIFSVFCDVSKQFKTASHYAQTGTFRACFLFISSVKCLIYLNLFNSKLQKVTSIPSNLYRESVNDFFSPTVLNLWMWPFGHLHIQYPEYQTFILLLRTVSKVQVWSCIEIILWLLTTTT